MPIAKLKYLVANGDLATGNFAPCSNEYNIKCNAHRYSKSTRYDNSRYVLLHCVNTWAAQTENNQLSGVATEVLIQIMLRG
jgi:hypothetical protein